KVSVVLRHVRTATGWMERIEFTRRLRRPSAFIKGIEGWREEPLTETWAKYFPSIPAEKQRKFQYPLTLSDAFWGIYSEPVVDLLREAIKFRNAVDGLSKIKEDPQRAWYAREYLHDLVESVRPILAYGSDKKRDQTWVAPSLLSNYAMMVLLDRLESCRGLSCVVCNRVFWTRNPRAKYCTDEHCRWKGQKRRQRGRPEDIARPRGRPRSETND